MKLAIVGSRGFKSLGLVADFIKKLKPTTKVLSGGARGVDRFAVAQAKARGLDTEEFFANWNTPEMKFQRAAGFQRNLLLISAADGVVAFWDRSSPGTAHSIRIATEWKKWLRIYFEDGTYQQISKGAFQ